MSLQMAIEHNRSVVFAFFAHKTSEFGDEEEVKRVEAVSHFSESIQGLITLHIL